MKKNIVIVVSALNMGGAQRVVSILCNHWSQSGYAVTIISTFTGKKINHFQLNKDVTLKYLDTNPFFSKMKIFNLIWKLICLRRVIKEINPNIVISFLTRVNVATTLSNLGTKFPLIVCERSWPPFLSLSEYFFWMYKILFKRVDKFVVQTLESKTWFSQNMPGSKIEVIPNPIVFPLPLNNEQLVNPDLKVATNKKIILASGRLHRYKQFDMLIRAFSRIASAHQDWDLVILGDGEERSSLHKLSTELEIDDRVIFLGSVGNMAEWYERADLFVMSSKLEGFPNVLLEAMSHGLPSISFDCNTGPRDMVKDGLNGILVDPDERELGLENAMKKLITNKALRKKFSQNSILLKDEYSIRNIIKKWDKALSLYY